ncbi:type I glyceraldehyde-3-phosphate dehydrogenase [Alphaproteobacteria bacterium]|nr:type I glyceraldehyde-3-phosphate dehydrogenase [Alphaproteobacteria bacterium]MBT5798772.1 type I glyceraldehyde-3-phosphate dehydrogenase [Alphaproteobacteria bacterium]MDA9189852.1 type I glyceraldehyde-3-phosphate dehydrogenase [Alphaproteobacteria bacterium]MDA9815945.1 type I glyceraldehyde-3-phosphate dehydrogenase [Alphaproteobacteria bacterium]MDC0394331.1 type I glyceraldehyde-3-phosphate dehydrogenase [Alphaproteobacteria bacterium]
MTIKVAINGFGRIGRNVFRALIENPRSDIEIIAVNTIPSLADSAYLLEFDSVHGRLPVPISIEGDMMHVGGNKVRFLSERNPESLNWGSLGVDVVMECTGIFTDADKAAVHINAGAKKVLVSAPSKGADLTVVYGVNHSLITAEHKIISNASCTTNCLAPIAHILHNTCGIKQGFMTTIHSYTGDQRILDTEHSDLYRSRAAALNLIPTTTGAAKAVGLVLPELNGKLDGVAIRVPTPNVSAVDFVFEPVKPTSAEQINQRLKEAANGELKGVLDITERQLVSTDFNHHPASSIAHLDQTRVMPDGMTRIFSWYDNEWGFSNRMLDTVSCMG